MNTIVDVQGFKNDANKFFVKEIAIITNNHIQAFLIKPPFPFYDLSKEERRQVSWIERNRKLFWRDGYIPYTNYKNYIIPYLKDKIIHVKGSEKVIWLKEILDTDKVYNLEDKHCPSLLSLYKEYDMLSDVYSCLYHPYICALKNVICLRKWCHINKVF